MSVLPTSEMNNTLTFSIDQAEMEKIFKMNQSVQCLPKALLLPDNTELQKISPQRSYSFDKGKMGKGINSSVGDEFVPSVSMVEERKSLTAEQAT